ncbi:MAG: adenylate/guanylate cyclase domain-containing protein [Pseudomonadota bacterium]
MTTMLRALFGPKSLLFAGALVVAAGELLLVHATRPLENRLLDAIVRQHAATLEPDPSIVIVDIDDASLKRLEDVAGSWPWPRSVHAELVQGLQRQRPRAIVFDITFTEKDVYRPDSDRLFNEALAGNRNIYFPLVRMDAARDGAGPLASQVAPLLGLEATPAADAQARLALLPPLALDPAYWRTGSINFTKDEDGVGRRYDLFSATQGWLVPSLPARLARELGYAVPHEADMLLSWRGGVRAFPHISYADLYEDFSREHPRRAPMELKDKIVIIGSDASGMNDLRATPVSSLYPGAQILATAIDNLKNTRMMATPVPWLAPLLTMLALAAVFWSFARSVNVLKTGAALLALSALAVGATWLAIARLLLVPALSGLMLVWAYYFAGALQAWLAERKSRQQAISLFSRFVNPHVVQQLVQHGGVLRSGESRQISVLFSDIRGFTTLSENRTPQEVVVLLNRYFTLQVEVVFRHGGSLDKFIGDCIMAFWGAPLDDPRHAHNAVAAALEMADVLQRFKAELGEQDADFDVGIGIHSGPAVVGLIGSEQRREYTAIGDTVNLASRIEGLTKGVSRILVSQETMDLCGEAYRFTAFGSFAVKGREQEVCLFGPQRENKK